MGDRWGIYARISYVKRQTKDGKTVIETLGVDRQKPPCEALVERMDGIVVDTYVDNDISAYHDKRRPDYERMLADAQTGVIDGIVAWHPDRLTRRPSENERLIMLAETYGTKLATVQAGECDLSAPAGRLMFRMLGNIGRYESEHKAARQMLKNEQMAAAGEPAPGPRAYGFEKGNAQLKPDEAKIIREVVRRLLAGEELGGILRDLRKQGITGTGNKRFPGGKPFTATSLRNVVTNPRIAGIRVLRGEMVIGEDGKPVKIKDAQGEDLAIISESDLFKVRGIFARNAADFAEGKHPGAGRSYAYSGLIRCLPCGGRLVGSSGAYRCQSCRGTYVQQAPFEAAMDELVLTWISGPTFAERLNRKLAALRSGDTTESDLAADRAELADLEAVPERFRAQVDPSGARAVELRARVQAAEARLASRPEVAALLDTPTSAAALRRAWSSWTVEQKRARLVATIERIEIRPAGRRARFDPARIEVTWR